MAVPRGALNPFFKALKNALGPEAANVKVSIAGALRLQIANIRNTKDVDILIFNLPEGYTPAKIRDAIVASSPDFTRNLEAVCGVTFRNPDTKEITPFDIVSPAVTGFTPVGTRISSLRDSLAEEDLPLASPEEIVKMKLLSSARRDDQYKSMQDLKDVKALVSAFALTITYRDDDERAEMKRALEIFLPTYLETEEDLTHDDWMKMLGFE
ncbi:hypothetical protein BKA70DRAFT_1565634 [Coprinopsis sp. MPI-PUGE-AT-0042]|nr:hypothetical protein BKA70DRAFT_1565634 [Coprinopsis sp. MPI-PUGE-AT-0042]